MKYMDTKIAQDEDYNEAHNADELMLNKHIVRVSSFKNTFLHRT